MEWFFNGIGTELVSFILGILTGVVGYKFHITRQTQKAGRNSVQMQGNKTKNGDISADKVLRDKNSPGGDYIAGDKIISNIPDELDIRNFSNYSPTQIEIVIAKGNNATLRKWCLELILNQGKEYLIRNCIENMDNDVEKYKLLKELSKRNFEDSKYFSMIGNSLSKDVYRTKAIELYISIGKTEYIETTFSLIKNNEYIYKSLIAIYKYNKELFNKLYDNGNCFDNTQYPKKINNFLKEEAG